MQGKPFHMGWFLAGTKAQSWGQTWAGNTGREWMDPDLYVSVARELERGGFDYILLEDNTFVADTYANSMDATLRNAVQTPRQEPMIMAPWMLQATQHIGIVPTVSTFAYHPYLLARSMATLDQLSGGRAGWNMVTGSSDRAVQNYGFDAMAEHDMRYDIADEYVDLANALWDSWQTDAIVDDVEGGVFADPSKVAPVNFRGKHFSSRGPLNSGPPIQGRPVLAQAGSSPRGRQFASTYADTIVGSEASIDRMKAFRDDVRARMVAGGRNPDECKILFVVSPIVAATKAEAQERREQKRLRVEANVESTLTVMSKTTGIDFAELPLDEPLGEREWTTNGSRATLEMFVERNKGKTLREAAVRQGYGMAGDLDLIGTTDEVAAKLCEINDAIDGDGFLFGSDEVSRRFIAEIVDGLVPELRKRGVARTGYGKKTFRENLLEF